MGVDWQNGSAADEYDGYLLKVAGMIRRNEPNQAAVDYLVWGESVNMGLGIRSDTRTRAQATVDAIRADDMLWSEPS